MTQINLLWESESEGLIAPFVGWEVSRKVVVGDLLDEFVFYQYAEILGIGAVLQVIALEGAG